MDADLHFIWKAIVIVIGGVLILRLAGRKSISQLTVAQTVMMVAVGSLIIQPVGDRNIWNIFSGHHGLWPSQSIFEPKSRLYNPYNGETISNVEKRKKR